jgi:ectoine hydroxylase-related dioxygenase (phytanoyl-CoA dioxygenase family)
MIVRVMPSQVEQNARTFSGETIEKASSCVRADGALVIQDIIDPALIIEARQAFVQGYARYLNGQEHGDALQVGDRRLMITVGLEAPFDRPELFANAWLLQVLRAVFADDFVLGGYGVVCSLPGAQSQHCHRDGGILFPQSGLDRLLPAAAVTVAIPLLEMNDIHGTTAIWLGSHRDSDLAALHTSAEKGEEPAVQEGSCVLWDYRVAHAGTPNRSTVSRPLLYLMYCRPWFLDHTNYQKQPVLRASSSWLSTLSGENLRLLARATARGLPEISP